MTLNPHDSSGKSHPAPAGLPAGGQAQDPWTWHRRTLEGLRQRLIEGHRAHLRESVAPADRDYNDLADIASEQSDRDVLFAELGAVDNQLAEVEAALQRLQAGTYGRCEVTGRAIPAERLRALPWTRYSREAAEKIERDSNPQKPHEN